MYCPNCSQPQASDEMRFCSRCGFPLSGVRDLIAGGGALAAGAAEAGRSRSQKGARRGAWLMLTGLALALFVALLTAADDDFAFFGIIPFLCFVIGFVFLMYGVFIADKLAPRVKRTASPLPAIPVMPGQIAAARNFQLSAPRVAPIESFPAQRVDTAKMVAPPSVTENTTRLLEAESDPGRE